MEMIDYIEKQNIIFYTIAELIFCVICICLIFWYLNKTDYLE